MFERAHHQRIASVLHGLDAGLLRAHGCLFGGGTAIALRHGEYRESVDMDFLVSDLAHYRALRQLTTGVDGMGALARAGAAPWAEARPVRADQYGIRTFVTVVGQPIKLEIVLEARMALDAPIDEVCGVPSLTARDLLASKLLANADRWADDSFFSRDLIDMAMMQPALPLLRGSVLKAEQAYGASIRRDLGRALDKMQTRTGWLARCMQAMSMSVPPALVWQRMRRLRRVL